MKWMEIWSNETKVNFKVRCTHFDSKELLQEWILIFPEIMKNEVNYSTENVNFSRKMWKHCVVLVVAYIYHMIATAKLF